MLLKSPFYVHAVYEVFVGRLDLKAILHSSFEGEEHWPMNIDNQRSMMLYSLIWTYLYQTQRNNKAITTRSSPLCPPSQCI